MHLIFFFLISPYMPKINLWENTFKISKASNSLEKLSLVKAEITDSNKNSANIE